MEQQVYQKKIKAVHGDQFGHGGIQRTINLLTQKKQHWRGMRKDVRNLSKDAHAVKSLTE